MRVHVVRSPQAAGLYPGILLYSEIFQVTAPIRRTAALLAGHGYVVAIPEIWHEFESAGCILPYDQAGADRGNALKLEKELRGLDGDSRAVLDFLKSHPLAGQTRHAGYLHRRPSQLSVRLRKTLTCLLPSATTPRTSIKVHSAKPATTL